MTDPSTDRSYLPPWGRGADARMGAMIDPSGVRWMVATHRGG